MESLQLEDRPIVARAISLAKYIDERVEYFRKEHDREKLDQNREYYWSRYRLYRSFQDRAFRLVFETRNPKIFGKAKFSFLIQTPAEYLKRKAERIAKGKDIFESKHKYSLHFFQSGLHQDYGSFRCDRCKVLFHHSPSTITKAAEVVYSCACGYCTNEIIEADWNNKPYH